MRTAGPPWRAVVLGWAVAIVLGAAPAATPDIRPGAPGQPAGAVFRDCPQCPEMVTVTAGTFARAFAYGKTRVTFRDWKQCVLAGQCQSLGAATSATLDPLVRVSWVDAQQYLSWLTLETGTEYRLLSEAEWEYVARGPAPGSPGFGGDGLEWTSDCWHPDLAGAPGDGSSWEKAGGGDCRYHVARGRRPGDAGPATAKRYRFAFDTRDGSLGFRVARTL